MSDPLEVVVEEARTCRSTSLPRASMRAKDGAGPLFEMPVVPPLPETLNFLP